MALDEAGEAPQRNSEHKPNYEDETVSSLKQELSGFFPGPDRGIPETTNREQLSINKTLLGLDHNVWYASGVSSNHR